MGVLSLLNMAQENNDDTQYILPIICPHCQGELSLEMFFQLNLPLPPGPKKVEKKENDTPQETES